MWLIFWYQGFQCAVVWHKRGHWCGYVKVKQEHPRAGRPHDEHNDLDTVCPVSWSAPNLLPDRYDPEEGWWIGFDTLSKFGDEDPGMNLVRRETEFLACLLRIEELEVQYAGA